MQRTSLHIAALAAAATLLAACGGPETDITDSTSSNELTVGSGGEWMYRNAMVSPWQDWSWATRNLANTRPVTSGKRSIAVTYGAWQGIYFRRSAPVSSGKFAALILQVNGGNTSGAVLQARAVLADDAWTSGVKLGPTCTGGSIPANKWTTCTVSLSAIAPSRSNIVGIVLQEGAGKSLPKMYFDEIGLRATSTSAVAVSVAPATASLAVGGAAQFSATVSGSTNTAVTWKVQEGASGGSIGTNGLYTAPTTAGTYHVVATSQADTTKSGTATVTVTTSPPPQTVSVAISPTAASIATGQTQQFTATVAGTTNTSVSWTVQEGSAGGGVSSTGLYTAPSTAGTYHLVATSQADSTKSATAAITVSSPTPPPSGATYALPADRTTVWNPGLNSVGGIPNRTTICATVTPSYASGRGLSAFNTDGTGNAEPAIQYAIDNCPSGQVVSLPAGTYRLNAGLNISSSITLRGAGPSQTKLRLYNSADWVVAIWPGWPTWSAAVNVTTDLAKGATQIPIASTSAFSVGDIIQIDQTDDTSYLYGGGCPYFKRYPGTGDYGPAPSSARSLGQTVEITAISGNTLTIRPQLHHAHRLSLTPQVFKSKSVVKNAGVEDLYVTGGTVEQIQMQDAAYCWVKHVESDGTVSSNAASDGTLGQGNGMTGDHLVMMRTFRCEVRDSYFHHATHVVQGGGAYGISLADHSSDNLVENNIIYYLNKPLTMRASGGGNVIAYNYVDNAWTSADDGLQETTIDLGHCSFPYMELAEGNYSPQIATENVWGNSGWMTIFRNYASGKQQRTNAYETYQIAAIAMEIKARYMNVIGNVLGSTGNLGAGGDPMQYEVTSNPPGPYQPAVYRLGHGLGAGNGGDNISSYESPGASGSTVSQMIRDGNYDYVSGEVHWYGLGGYGVGNGLTAPTTTTMPYSMYLSSKPAFFGSYTWPWVEAQGSTKLYTLPAKARFDAGTPNG